MDLIHPQNITIKSLKRIIIMDQQTKEYFEAAFDMFASKGYKDFIESLKEIRDAVDVRNVADEKQLFKLQGSLEVLDGLLAHEEVTRATYDEITTESSD